MRILLAAHASYVPPRGGATRSNLLWLEQLAAAGHACRVVAAALADTDAKREQLAQENSDWHALHHQPGMEVLERGSIQLWAVADRGRQALVLRRQIAEFQPDWVLISSEDLSQVLLTEAHRSAPGRVVYIAHTPQFFPFGPASWNPDAHATGLVAHAAGVVAIGQHTAGYIKRYTGREVAVIHPPTYGAGPFPDLSNFDSGLVTMVNPCAIKGISIFTALAERFPQFGFGAVPGWGTTVADRAQLAALPNASLLPHCPTIADFLRRTRVLLMPSLWYEGFGLTVMEAMLHGIPVIASDAGGLVEAKSGTPFIVSVQGIERYEPLFDEHGLPRPVIPPQNIEPWTQALHALLADRELYQQVSAASRQAALRFVGGLDAGRMAEYLASLARGESLAEPPSLAGLSPDKRALLLQRMRKG